MSLIDFHILFNGFPFTSLTDYEHNDITVSLCGCHHCGHSLASNPYNNPMQCCKCDCTCVSIDDCCADFDVSKHCNLEDPSDLVINNVDVSLYDCIGVPGSDSNNYAFVLVSKCPASWTDINTRLNCEVERNLTDVVGLLPVIDGNGVTYKNIFCAFCHGQSVNEVTFWEITKLKSPFFGGADGGYTVRWPDIDNARPRSCPYGFVDSCPGDAEASLIASCQSYFAPFFLDGYPKPFWNPHCAICNGFSDQLLTEYCTSCDVSCPFGSTEGRCYEICPTLDRFLTVDVLFDFTDLDSNQYGTDASQTCEQDAIYDPFLEKCRSLSCPPDFILVDSTCEPLNPPDPVITDTEVIGSKESLRSFSCMLDILGYISVEDIGAIDVITREMKREIVVCKSSDIGCVTTGTSRISVAFLFKNEVQLMNLTNAITSFLIANYTLNLDNPAIAEPICNITSMAAYIRYSNKFALPSKCEPFTTDVSEDFDADLQSDIILSFAQYDFDEVTSNYTESNSPSACLIPTSLNCSATITLNQTEYELMSDESIRSLIDNTTVSRDQYLLLSSNEVLVCYTKTPINPTLTRRSPLDIIAAVCQCLSVVALLATFITYLIFAALRNLAGKVIMSLTAALCLAYLCLLLAGVFLFNSAACTIVAILAHYFWIAAFTWMMTFAFNIAKTFSRQGAASRRSHGNSSFLKYSFFGWSLPVVVIGVCIGLHFCQCTSITFRYGNIVEGTCFLRGGQAILYSFVVPISVLLLLSIVFFTFMAIHLRLRRSESKMARSGGTVQEISFEVGIYLKVRIVMSWIQCCAVLNHHTIITSC